MAGEDSGRSNMRATGTMDAYPEFKLEDELFHQGGGSVMDSFFHQQYTRRRKPIKDQGPISD
jgi:hypothetical protein